MNVHVSNIRRASPFQQRAWEWWCPVCGKKRWLKTGPARRGDTRKRLCVVCSNAIKAAKAHTLPYTKRPDGTFEYNCQDCGALVVLLKKPNKRTFLCRPCGRSRISAYMAQRFKDGSAPFRYDDPNWVMARTLSTAEKLGWNIETERACLICGNRMVRE